ncbi:HlyD family type I secretion periplasmic adaptor subunit [Kiloniella sp.]|uniref:HlyD family type I secretion periplasmic adaptor subunit n=1 Tax=Kiloniella sp. TaxID=1938587 RepID=UPI003B0258E6
MPNTITKSSTPLTRKPIFAGLMVISLFFGGFFGWAYYAPLDSATLASGKVIVEGQRKTVQHLEGGIVSQILVREGQVVKQGEILLTLDSTKARAVLALLDGRRISALSVAARVRAERDGLENIVFPNELLRRAKNLDIADVLKNQEVIFQTRRVSVASQSAILKQRIAQYNEEIKGIKGQISAETDQIKLIDEEIGIVRGMFKKGLARKPRLLSLQRQAAEISGSRAQHRAQIARAEQSIGESRLRIAELKNQYTKEIVEQLKSTQAEVRDLDERILAALDVMQRTNIRAPISGTIVGLQVHSNKGVITPGSDLMDLVPLDGRLIVDAKIAPKDIDTVQLGQVAQVRMSAFNQRNSTPLKANVLSISADRLTDAQTGLDFYRVEIELDNSGSLTREQKLVPGMDAEVMILAGQKTLIEYFFEPISQGFNRAFREI